MSDTRGLIHYRERAKQIRDFSGLRFGNITPTDIDALIEYKNKGYVFIETKSGDSEMPYGQRLALERIESDILNKKKRVLVLITQHDYPADVDIDMAETVVIEFRENRKWRKPVRHLTAREAVTVFVNLLDGIKP